MTADQIGGIIRALVAAGSAYVIKEGWADANTTAWIGGGIVLLATGAWSWWTNRPQKIVDPATGQPKAS